MAQSLKDEGEEIVVRCHLAKGDADRAVAETVGHANPGKLHVIVHVHVRRIVKGMVWDFGIVHVIGEVSKE